MQARLAFPAQILDTHYRQKAMAFSSRLTAAVRPLYQTAKVISPSAIGVLLSFGVHAVVFAFGPRTNFSFAALSAAAQQEEAEETIVPIVQLTPAERSRLPAFAQPRVAPPSASGLSNGGLGNGLGLPFNLSSPNRSAQLRSGQPQRQPVPAGRLPSPTLSPRSPFRQASRATLNPSTFRTRPAPSVIPSPRVSVLPLPATELPDIAPGNLPANSPTNSPANPSETTNPADSIDNAALPDLSGPLSSPSAQDLQTSPRSIGDALGAAENEGSGNANSTASAGGTSGEASEGVRSPSETENSSAQPSTESTDIAVQPSDPIDVAPAQGNANRLLSGFVYDPTDVSQAEAEVNLQAWLAETAENKSELDSQQVSISIDSNFKVCKENPPTDGLVGVVVNPDGTKEEIKVLKSIGYDVLNRQALEAIEQADFGQLATATQYQVTIEVDYDSDGCVEELPEATEDIDG